MVFSYYIDRGIGLSEDCQLVRIIMLDVFSLPIRLANMPNSIRLLEVWLKWRGQNLFPVSGDIKPEMLGPTMSSVGIMKFQDPNQLIVRMMSTDAVELFGRNLQGEDWYSTVPPEQRPRRVERIQNIRNTPCGIFNVVSRFRTKQGFTVEASSILLPAGDTISGQISKIYSTIDILSERQFDDNIALGIAPLAEEYEFIDIGAGVPG